MRMLTPTELARRDRMDAYRWYWNRIRNPWTSIGNLPVFRATIQTTTRLNDRQRTYLLRMITRRIG